MYNQTKRIVISKSNLISIKGQGLSLPIGKIVSKNDNSYFVRILNSESIYQSHMDSNNSKYFTFETKKDLLKTIITLHNKSL